MIKLPDHSIHRTLAKTFIGKAHPEVDRWMDGPYKYLGRGHRVLRHSIAELAIKYNPSTQAEQFQAGLVHLMADQIFKTKEQQFYMHAFMTVRNGVRQRQKKTRS